MSPIADAHFEELLGFELLSATDVAATARATVSPGILQPGEVVHGGVYAALALSLAEHASSRSRGVSPMRPLSNDATFLRPIGEGLIHLNGECLHTGRSTMVWSVQITDDSGRLCATSVVRLVKDAPALKPPGGLAR